MNVSQAFDKADHIKRLINSLLHETEFFLSRYKGSDKVPAEYIPDLQGRIPALSRAEYVSVCLQEQIDSINPDYPDPVTDQQEWAADVVDFSRDLLEALDAALSACSRSSWQQMILNKCKELLAEIGGLVQIVGDSWHDTQRGRYLCTVVVYGGLSEDGTSYAAYQNEDEHVVRFWDTGAVAVCL